MLQRRLVPPPICHIFSQQATICIVCLCLILSFSTHIRFVTCSPCGVCGAVSNILHSPFLIRHMQVDYYHHSNDNERNTHVTVLASLNLIVLHNRQIRNILEGTSRIPRIDALGG